MKNSLFRLSPTFLLFLLASSATAQNISPEITTHSGKVKGAEHQNTLSWTGIPYAKAPVGELRWKKPISPDAWQTVFDATRPATNCIQVSPDGAKGQEDCLNLNIYRPTESSTPLPVLVYIHGGNNQLGSSTEFAPAFIAEKYNAVIVTVNYRLGALGFNPLKALNDGNPLDDSGNYSLLDIKQSLAWIKDNIPAFGGDSNNITVSGFSAGGRDVMAMLISPYFKNTFNKAIVFSGGMTTSDKHEAESIFAQRLAPLVVKQGIKPDADAAKTWLLSGSPEVRHFLYQLPAADLAMLFGDAGIRMNQFPHLYRDGVVIPKDGFETKNYNAVPAIMATGQQEFSFFARNDPMFATQVKEGALVNNTPLLNKYTFANHYGGLLYSLFNVNQSAEVMYKNYHAPLYGMEFRYGTDAFVTGDKLSAIGSFHGVFMPFWDKNKYAEFTQDALKLKGSQALGEFFNSYIKKFLATGSPNDQTLPEWKKWTPDNAAAGESLLVMDANKQKAIIYMSNKTYSYKDILTRIEQDNALSAADKKSVIKDVLNNRWFSAPLDQHFAR